MPDALAQFVDLVIVHPILTSLLASSVLVFVIFFVVPWIMLSRHLRQLGSQVAELRADDHPDPVHIKTADRRLKHLWDQYCSSLHQPDGAVNPKTGARAAVPYRSTLPAEAIFNSQAIFEGRIHTEFFKHLPGLLTGLGIIGTFLGLIDGLERSTGEGNTIQTAVLIGSVKSAFQVSASAIVLAMLITFFEKFAVARLYSRVEGLCQDIDVLFSAGVGEDYLARMVRASEESASQARILKDALVGELTTILERLTERQIEASSRQQAALQTQLVEAIDQSLKQPLGRIADGFNSFSGSQGDKITQSLQDSMSAFAVKLEELLGGQVGQAKDLQKQTVQALEAAILSFQSMAKQVGSAGESATSRMAEQLERVVANMAARDAAMGEQNRTVARDLQHSMSAAQAEASAGLSRAVAAIGQQVSGVLDGVQSQAGVALAHQQQQAAQASDAHIAQQERTQKATEAAMAAFQSLAQQLGSAGRTATTDMADQLGKAMTEMAGRQGQLNENMRALVDQMRGSVAQTQAETSGSIHQLLGDLGKQIAALVDVMGEGAVGMQQAAEQFTGSGKAIADVFERSRAVSIDLNQAAQTLKASSSDVQSVVGDYRAARETFGGLVEGLRGVVDIAKREASMTSDLVTRLESAAQKLVTAQGQADAYLAQLNRVLSEAHGSFSTQMLATLQKTNTEFHQHLAKSTSLLASTIADLDGTIIEFAPRSASRGKLS
jgi:hypothetical protein